MNKEIKDVVLERPFSVKIQRNNCSFELYLDKNNIIDWITIHGKKVLVKIDFEYALENYLDLNYIFHSFDSSKYKEYSNIIQDIREPGCFVIGKRINAEIAQNMIQSFEDNCNYLTISSEIYRTILYPSGHIWHCFNLYKYPELHEIIFDLMQIINHNQNMEFVVTFFNCQVFLGYLKRDVSVYSKEYLYRAPVFGIHYYNGKFELLDSLQSQLVTERYLSNTNNILFNKPMSFFEAINTEVNEFMDND